jgi:hypothetical protein
MAELTTEYLDKTLDKKLAKALAEQRKTTFDLLKEQIDPLALSIAKDFNRIHEDTGRTILEFSRINHKLDIVSTRIKGLEDRTTAHFSLADKELAEIKQKIENVSKQSLEDTYEDGKDIEKLKKRVAKLELRMRRMEPYRKAKEAASAKV